MKIVVASDSFKGSLSSMEVAEGGEGSVKAVVESLKGKYRTVKVHGLPEKIVYTNCPTRIFI